MDKPNIFSEPKELKKWAIRVANACGGQEVQQLGIKINRVNIQKLGVLIDEFVNQHNETSALINQEEE
jgi:hypothetical protein|tara:strand:+ start:466 stop:669 length:204 start_codon:yes stop_codon:yes gene_type:complete